MGEQTTLLLEDRQAFRDAIKRLEIKYDWALNASKTELHTAIVEVGLEDPDRLKRKLREVQENQQYKGEQDAYVGENDE